MPTDRMDNLFDLVGSRRFCFIIMPYRTLELFYDHLRAVIQETTGLPCKRADDIPGSGQSLLDKVHALIESAELVVVECSEPSPNVYYEAGYAKALNKKVLVVCRTGTKLPTDLQGLERIEYDDVTRGALMQFDDKLRSQILLLVDSDMLLLRAMLVAPVASPSYILSSPRWRWREAHPPQFQRETRTYGDYLGVVGILYALGSLLGKEQLPGLLSAHHVDEAIIDRDCNLYLIGSPRSNIMTERAMAGLQQGRESAWSFELDPHKRTSTLVGWRDGKRWEWKGMHDDPSPSVDYGLLLRGPHPNRPGRQILCLGGTRSLGTGAVCLAATRPRFIREIRNRLKDVDMNDKTRVIWALIRGEPDPKDHHTSEDRIWIEDVGVIG
jgi:hypothetical protein